MTTAHKVTAGAACVLACCQANAFDVWGFHSGMSAEQAAAVGQRDGYEVRVPTLPSDSPRFKTLSFVKSGSSPNPQIGYLASFCDGKLTWISRGYQANIAALYGLVSDLKGQYGEPTVQAKSQMLTEGQARGLDFNFKPLPDDVVSIAVNLTLHSDTRFGIDVIHHNTEMRCN